MGLDEVRIIQPDGDWWAQNKIFACTTLKTGGVSQGPYASLNLGLPETSNDQAGSILHNRHLISEKLELPSQPFWLKQVHGSDCINARDSQAQITEADASYTDCPGQVLAILTADCLPVFIANNKGTEIALIHAGWRGLLDGVIQNTVDHMQSKGSEMQAWLGPAIGPEAFEVGAEVFDLFKDKNNENKTAFTRTSRLQYHADIYKLAKIALADVGVKQISGGTECTYQQQDDYFSYRRDGETGRMASLMWIVEQN
ncbi:MAG: peptidoglycan editing factor PgeF [bacterium]